MSENHPDHDPTQAEAEQVVLSQSPTLLTSVVQNAAKGVELSPQEQEILFDIGRVAASRTPALQIAFSQTMTSGPLPSAHELNAYDAETRSLILRMAEKEQDHAHLMRKNGQNGLIWKDRLGQILGFLIAVIGLGAAAWIAKYSALTAGIIATLDLLGMVTVFAAPRLYERYLEMKIKTAPPTQQKPRSRSKKR
nr:DUF2335 domain-containing protein [uncultured Pseudomonas sp.]BDD46416.1 hypothetical protein 2 [Moraxellaceae bacterium]